MHKHINMTSPAMESRTKPPGRWKLFPFDRLCAVILFIENVMLRFGAEYPGLVGQNVRNCCTQCIRIVSFGIRIAVCYAILELAMEGKFVGLLNKIPMSMVLQVTRGRAFAWPRLASHLVM